MDRATAVEARSGRVDPKVILPGISIGLVAGILSIVLQVSFAALLFTGDLSAYLSEGIAITLFAAFLTGLWITFRSGFPGVVAIPQDSATAILAPVCAGIAARMTATNSELSVFHTVLVAIALASLFSGVLFYVIGRLRKASLVRYIPYPVIGGFLAGTGWLLVSGGFQVMTSKPLGFSTLGVFLDPNLALLWLPGLVFAIAMLLILRRWSHFLLLPGLLTAAFVLFFLVLLLTGIPTGEARAAGALLGPFPASEGFQPRLLPTIDGVAWSIVFENTATLFTVAIVSVVSLLLYASGLEILSRRELDLNRELRACGQANLLAGLTVCGPTSFHTLSISALGLKVGANTRLVGLTSALCCLGALLLGPFLLSYFPTFLLGGLLIFLGLSFLSEWIYDGWWKLSRTDYILVWVIVIAMNAIGILPGVAIGIGIALVIFVIDYSRIDVVRREFTGETHRSNVERGKEAVRALDRHGGEILIFQLQGFLFFGSSHRVLDRIRERLQSRSVRFLLLDFNYIEKMDTSALYSFRKLLDLAGADDFQIHFVRTPEAVAAGLKTEFGIAFESGRAAFFPDLDRALEVCEGTILTEAADPPRANWPESVRAAIQRLPVREIEEEEVLIEQDDPHRTIFFVEEGRISVRRQLPDGSQVRLKKSGAGTLIGEMSFFTGQPASATVVATRAGRVRYCDEETLERLRAEDPEGVNDLLKYILSELSLRTQRLIKTVEILKR